MVVEPGDEPGWDAAHAAPHPGWSTQLPSLVSPSAPHAAPFLVPVESVMLKFNPPELLLTPTMQKPVVLVEAAIVFSDAVLSLRVTPYFFWTSLRVVVPVAGTRAAVAVV